MGTTGGWDLAKIEGVAAHYDKDRRLLSVIAVAWAPTVGHDLRVRYCAAQGGDPGPGTPFATIVWRSVSAYSPPVVTQVHDVARIPLGAKPQEIRAHFDGSPPDGLPVAVQDFAPFGDVPILFALPSGNTETVLVRRQVAARLLGAEGEPPALYGDVPILYGDIPIPLGEIPIPFGRALARPGATPIPLGDPRAVPVEGSCPLGDRTAGSLQAAWDSFLADAKAKADGAGRTPCRAVVESVYAEWGGPNADAGLLRIRGRLVFRI